MYRIDLDHEEGALLREILESYLSELRDEVSRTDTASYRDQLRAKEATIHALLERLGTSPGSEAYLER